MKKIIHIFIYIFALIGLLFTGVYFGMKFGLTNASSRVDSQQEVFISGALDSSISPLYPTHVWSQSPEWQVFETAVKKDVSIISKAGEKADVSPRLLMSILAVEQMRLFHSERAIYEEVFSPLKILAVQSQFSWGVMGIKRETAIEIERRDDSGLLQFETADSEKERFSRLTDQHDRSWSYLYAGVYLHEIREEWTKAGFSIEKKPGILATLYNIGFQNSRPNASPALGGAAIEIGESTYTFGAFAHDVYYSDVLLEEFPK